MKQNYRLDTDFEMVGVWTIPGYNISTGITGKLTFKNNLLLLDLYDDINNIKESSAIQYIGADNVIEEYIIGFSQDGYTIIIENAIRTNFNLNSPGFALTQYSSHKSIIMQVNYAHYDFSLEKLCHSLISDGLDAIECKSCRFSLKDMNVWMNSSVIKRKEKKKSECIYFDLLEGEEEQFPVQDKNLLFSSDVICKSSPNTLSEEHFWRLESNDGENLTLGELKQNIDLLKNLFQLFVDSPTEYTFIDFQIAIEGKVRKTIPTYYIFSQYKSHSKTKISLYYTDIKDNFNLALKNWYEKNEQLSLIIDNYLNDININYFSESKLLNAIKNLEIYHRNFKDTSKNEQVDAELEKSKEILIKYIEENIEDKEYQDRFIRNIKHNPEWTLSKRLRELFKGLDSQLINKFLKLPNKSPSDSISSIVNSLVQTRNYYTHGDDLTKYPQSITDTIKQLEITSMLYQIVKYFIYDELGILDDVVIKNVLEGRKTYI